jgi:hypothetical protein
MQFLEYIFKLDADFLLGKTEALESLQPPVGGSCGRARSLLPSLEHCRCNAVKHSSLRHFVCEPDDTRADR